MQHYIIKETSNKTYKLYYRGFIFEHAVNDVEYKTIDDAVKAYQENTGSISAILRLEDKHGNFKFIN